MKMNWSGIESTFRSVFQQQSRISEVETRRRLSSMILMLRASTPKDTGFAQSRWAITGMFPTFRVLNDASYIEYLNHGSSRQAPAFFVEAIALRFGRPLGNIVTVYHSSQHPDGH